MRTALAVATTLLIVSAACGGSTPTEPTAGGATISGRIVSAATLHDTRAIPTSVSAASSSSAMTVSVVGSGVSATVSSGEFTLSGVPSGPVSLRFTGNGFDDELGLAPVEGAENIDILLSTDGTSLALESERRRSGRETQLEGRVDGLPPSTPDATFIVAGQTVTTSDDTRFVLRGHAASFSDLALGFRVHVKGQMNGDSLAASAVNIQNTNDVPAADEDEDENDGDDAQDESASIEGLLTNVGGAGTALTLRVGNTTVLTDARTRVQRKGDTQDLSVLQLGMRLHVVGTRQGDTSLLARKIQIKGDAPGSEFEIEGAVGGLKGTCPALTFSVNGYRIATDAATAFTPACVGLKSGAKVTVDGVVQADGSVKASAVTQH